jgi:hypothetical protein
MIMRRLTAILVLAICVATMPASARAGDPDVARLKQRLQALEHQTATAEGQLADLILLKAGWEEEKLTSLHGARGPATARSRLNSRVPEGGPPEGWPDIQPPPGRPVKAETALHLGERVLVVTNPATGNAVRDDDYRWQTTVLEVLPAGYVRVVARTSLYAEAVCGSNYLWPGYVRDEITDKHLGSELQVVKAWSRIVPRELLEVPSRPQPGGPVEAVAKAPPAATAGLPASLARLAARIEALSKDDDRSAAIAKEMQLALASLLGVEHPKAEELVPALRHEDRVVRTTAAMALVQIRPLVPEVVSVLLDWPDEESWQFQDWEPDIPSVRELKREFKDDYPNIEAKSWALASCGRCVVPRLLTADRYLSDASNGWPCRGVFWLLRRDARAVAPMLIAGLHHEDPRVREVAAVGLGALERRAAAAVPALQQAAGDPSHEVQDQAREALLQILGDVEQAKVPPEEDEPPPVP